MPAGWSRGSTSRACATPVTRSNSPPPTTPSADEPVFLDITASSSGSVQPPMRRCGGPPSRASIPLTVGRRRADHRGRGTAAAGGRGQGVAEHPPPWPGRSCWPRRRAVRGRSAWCSRWACCVRPAGDLPSGSEVTTDGGRRRALESMRWPGRPGPSPSASGPSRSTSMDARRHQGLLATETDPGRPVGGADVPSSPAAGPGNWPTSRPRSAPARTRCWPPACSTSAGSWIARREGRAAGRRQRLEIAAGGRRQAPVSAAPDDALLLRMQAVGDHLGPPAAARQQRQELVRTSCSHRCRR